VCISEGSFLVPASLYTGIKAKFVAVMSYRLMDIWPEKFKSLVILIMASAYFIITSVL